MSDIEITDINRKLYYICCYYSFILSNIFLQSRDINIKSKIKIKFNTLVYSLTKI